MSGIAHRDDLLRRPAAPHPPRALLPLRGAAGDHGGQGNALRVGHGYVGHAPGGTGQAQSTEPRPITRDYVGSRDYGYAWPDDRDRVPSKLCLPQLQVLLPAQIGGTKVARNQTGCSSDLYEMRVMVKENGTTETTYFAHDPFRGGGGGGIWRPLTQQAYSKLRQAHPGYCRVVVTVARGVLVRDTYPVGPC